MSTPVLVTGGRAKSGAPTVDLLVGAGVEVRAGTRDPRLLEPRAGVVPTAFDWHDEATWPAAVADVDRVYLVRPDEADAPDLVARLVGLAPRAHVVLLSEQGGGAVEPESWVGRVERAVTRSAASWTLLRPSWFHQVLSDERFNRGTIRDDDTFGIASGGAPLAWVDARDIAAVAASALLDPERHAGRAYTLTGPEALTVAEVAGLLSAATGRDVRPVDHPRDKVVAGLPAWLAEVYGDVVDRTRAGDFGVVTDHVRAVTGQAPRPLADFVTEHAHLWRR